MEPKRYILTGTPGSGKTCIINELRLKGYFTINEAATDIIAEEQKLKNKEPWQDPKFLEKIIILQKERQFKADLARERLQFYDRSPICTLALANFLNFPISEMLNGEIERIKKLALYQKQVFFIENLGHCTETDARKISFKEALVFEKLHRETYSKLGYNCVSIPANDLAARVEQILALLKNN